MKVSGLFARAECRKFVLFVRLRNCHPVKAKSFFKHVLSREAFFEELSAA